MPEPPDSLITSESVDAFVRHPRTRDRNSEALHTLKNQMGVILGFVELLLAESGLGTQQTQDLLEIRKAAERALVVLETIGGEASTET
jgi:hypothetical protein